MLRDLAYEIGERLSRNLMLGVLFVFGTRAFQIWGWLPTEFFFQNGVLL